MGMEFNSSGPYVDTLWDHAATYIDIARADRLYQISRFYIGIYDPVGEFLHGSHGIQANGSIMPTAIYIPHDITPS